MEKEKTLTLSDGFIITYRHWQAPSNKREGIVLLHGIASNFTRWTEFVDRTQLKENFDLIRPDMRGHGKSFTRKLVNVRRWCQDTIELLDAEGYDRVILVGHSLGAQVALYFQKWYPTRTSGLILIDPLFREALTGFTRLWSYLMPIMWLASSFIRILNHLRLRRRQIPQRDLYALDEEMRIKYLNTGKYEEMLKIYSSPFPDMKHMPSANYLKEFYELFRPTPSLKEIKIPVLIVTSKSATYTDFDRTVDILSRIPKHELVIIDAFHWPLTEKPDEIRQAIEQWCYRHYG